MEFTAEQIRRLEILGKSVAKIDVKIDSTPSRFYFLLPMTDEGELGAYRLAEYYKSVKDVNRSFNYDNWFVSVPHPTA